MKIEIERAKHIERKIVVQEKEYNDYDSTKETFECFRDLVFHLQEIFGINNSKHKKIGYINALCSEHLRWELQEQMNQSLENPKNDEGD